MKTAKEFKQGLIEQAKCMGGVMVPKHYWCPGPRKYLTAGQMAKAIKAVRTAYNKNPEIEVKQSFQAWWPEKVKDVLRWEILPAIHERINVRGLMNAN